MKHRIRVAPIADGKLPAEVTFLEIKPDFWLEMDKAPAYLMKHPKEVAEFIASYDSAKQARQGVPIGFATRAFSIGIIRDWREAGEVDLATS